MGIMTFLVAWTYLQLKCLYIQMNLQAPCSQLVKLKFGWIKSWAAFYLRPETEVKEEAPKNGYCFNGNLTCFKKLKVPQSSVIKIN